MATEYYYANPTGNITLLVPMPEDASKLPEKAAALMSLEPSAEQVGFLSGAGDGFDITLQMAGGEFCGNAAMASAAVFALRAETEDAEVHVLVSGAEQPVPVRIHRIAENTYAGTVSMPAPLSIDEPMLSLDGMQIHVTAVRFPGITHLVSKTPIDRKVAEASIPLWCREFKADAIGVILLDPAEKTLTPLVYVQKSGTLFWESSCASGTAAAGAALRRSRGPGSWVFSEPAGSLRIDATAEGSLLLSGQVSIEKRRSNL